MQQHQKDERTMADNRLLIKMLNGLMVVYAVHAAAGQLASMHA